MAPVLVVRVNAYPHRVEETSAWEREAFAREGVGYRFARPTVAAELHEAVANADAVVAGGGVFDAAAFAAMRHCKVLVSCSVGLDRVDLDAASAPGAMVCDMP